MIISPSLLDSPAYLKLKRPAKHLFLALAVLADQDGRAYPSISRLAMDTGMGKRQIRAAIKGLKKGKLIDIERRNGCRTTYTVLTGGQSDTGSQSAPGANQHPTGGQSDRGPGANRIPEQLINRALTDKRRNSGPDYSND
ncbi:MAG: hypothetical protein A2487_00040 [Candidatus Raymondbacteria bacterium RifOxyC12_full_50_8]|nr:MAG: hypothetical protein A2487_00040 [Candidatus Raymondbacteria bacterium RifOxyC12_full_50_8]